MPSNPIPLPRPDPEVQALKQELMAVRAHLDRVDACAYINEENTLSAMRFSLCVAWAITALLLSVWIGPLALAFTAVACWFGLSSGAARRRAIAASKKLPQLR